MQTVNILEAKTHLSKLVEAVESGVENEIILARNGKPAVRIVPLAVKKGGMILGLAKGKLNLPDDFEARSKALDKEIEALFYGEECSRFTESGWNCCAVMV